ncbi:MAG: hypothetical protein EOO48_02155 [Flavobacterium sp.]|nr:MAG: hypothetical protein EOO48_02155 [Flavobacterium sp.]
MKPVLILIFVFFTFLLPQQQAKLKGVYKLEYDNKYQLQTCQVTFSDSTFVKKLPDGLTTKGKIVYEKYKITLTPNNDNPIEIDGRELAKDSIKFTTRQKTDLSMVLNRGKLIRMK